MEFVDELPEAGGTHAKTKERAEEIKANAPRWAQWPSQTPATAVKKAMEKIDLAFEVVSRKCADGKTRAFVRYAPQNDAPTPIAAASASRPKVKCPTCAAFISVEPGEDNPKALTRHESTNVMCKSGNRRRSVAR